MVDKLIELGAYVTVADNLSKGSLDNIFEAWSKHGLKCDRRLSDGKLVSKGQTFVRCDLEDKSQVSEVLEDHEIVIHLAAAIGGRGYI